MNAQGMAAAGLIVVLAGTTGCNTTAGQSRARQRESQDRFEAARRTDTEAAYIDFLKSLQPLYPEEVRERRNAAHQRLAELVDDRMSAMVMATNRLEWYLEYLWCAEHRHRRYYAGHNGKVVDAYYLRHGDAVRRALDARLRSVADAVRAHPLKVCVRADLPASLIRLSIPRDFEQAFVRAGVAAVGEPDASAVLLHLSLTGSVESCTYSILGGSSQSLDAGFDLKGRCVVRLPDGCEPLDFRFSTSRSPPIVFEGDPLRVVYEGFVRNKNPSETTIESLARFAVELVRDSKVPSTDVDNCQWLDLTNRHGL
jgi:hypothetical protein